MESLYYMPCAGICLVHKRFGRFSKTPSAVISLLVRLDRSLYYTARDGYYVFLGRWGVSLTRPVLESISSFGGWGVSLTRPVLESVHRVRSLFYSSRIGISLVVLQVGTLY